MSLFVPFIHKIRKKEQPVQLPLYIEEYSPFMIIPIEKEIIKEEKRIIIIEL